LPCHAFVRAGVVAGVAAGALLGLAATASAHVTVNPSSAPAGSFSQLTFRVPTESDTASTVGVEVAFPTDHPIANISVQPKPGWTVSVKKTKLATPVTTDDGTVSEAVTRVSWKATAGGLQPGEFDTFAVSAGPLPTDVDSITLPAVQTYSDGSVVRWIEPRVTGGPAPDHPAPVLTLSKASSTDPSTSTAANSSSSSSDGTARALGVVGIVLGVLGLGVGGFAVIRGRGRVRG
jgi:periplasmic copper chaperone A